MHSNTTQRNIYATLEIYILNSFRDTRANSRQCMADAEWCHNSLDIQCKGHKNGTAAKLDCSSCSRL